MVFASNDVNFSAKDLYNERANLANLAHDILEKLDSVNYFTFDCSNYRVADEFGAEPEEEDASSELARYNHQAWLLSWNPKYWNDWDYPDLCQSINSANPFTDWWRCLSTSPKKDDEVYLYKAGDGPKGIIAHGRVIEESKNGKDIKLDERHDYIRVSFDCVLNFAKFIIPLEKLNERFPDQTWASQSSGIEIKPECTKGLRDLWNELLSKGQIEMMDRNLIRFGAPGTGKSYEINKFFKESGWSSKERVTFHPDYSYANFVGSYKPYMEGKSIVYKFVPGPFTRVLVNALRDPKGKHLLVIEEINRANTAAVFGDIFQLLDRGKNGESEYAISPSQDLAKFLREALKQPKKNDDAWWWLTTEPLAEKEVEGTIRNLKIPSNMYLWATMNSADQGVFPMDTAFKRRWSFEYVGIDAGQDAVKGELAGEWNKLRQAINGQLVKALKVNEDKCMGPFFLSEGDLDKAAFLKVFKSKVLMYLFEDAARQKRSAMFADGRDTLSEIFAAVEKKEKVFKDDRLEEILDGIRAVNNSDQNETEGEVQVVTSESGQQKNQEHNS